MPRLRMTQNFGSYKAGQVYDVDEVCAPAIRALGAEDVDGDTAAPEPARQKRKYTRRSMTAEPAAAPSEPAAKGTVPAATTTTPPRAAEAAPVAPADTKARPDPARQADKDEDEDDKAKTAESAGTYKRRDMTAETPSGKPAK